jgi:hypothetical protein
VSDIDELSARVNQLTYERDKAAAQRDAAKRILVDLLAYDERPIGDPRASLAFGALVASARALLGAP